MPSFEINIPIREIDAEDVKNAFAYSYGYSETVEIGGVVVPNPISKEEFVKQKCINFMLDITKSHMVKTEEISAKEAAQEIAATRATEVTQWFDTRRLDSIGGISIFQNFPSVDDLSLTTNKNESVSFAPTGTDPDDLPLTFTISANPAHGLILGTSPNFIYLPNNRFFGLDSFKIKAHNGTKFSLEKNVPVVINRTLTSVDAFYYTRKNQNLTINLSAYDNVGEVTFTLVDLPDNGIINGTNPIIYTPNSNFLGLDTLTFTTQDDTLQGNLATVTIEVNDIIAESQTYFVNKNEVVTIHFNAINAIGSFSFNVIDQPINGNLTGSQEITYVPSADFVGTDEFTFTVTDSLGTSETGIITIVVNDI